MVLDGVRADEQSGRDLFVGVAFRREASDLQLLWSELAQRVCGPFAGMLPCRLQFEPCALCKRVHAEVAEELVGGP